MILSGIFIFFALVLLYLKLSTSLRLRLLGHPLMLDIGVSTFTLLVHWGSFTGIMAATIAGLLTSAATTLARRVFGYTLGKDYHPGMLRAKG